MSRKKVAPEERNAGSSFPDFAYYYIHDLKSMAMGHDLLRAHQQSVQACLDVAQEHANSFLFPEAKGIHDKAVAAGAALYDYTEGMVQCPGVSPGEQGIGAIKQAVTDGNLKWPALQADRVKMRIVQSTDGRAKALFFIGYDS